MKIIEKLFYKYSIAYFNKTPFCKLQCNDIFFGSPYRIFNDISKLVDMVFAVNQLINIPTFTYILLMKRCKVILFCSL